MNTRLLRGFAGAAGLVAVALTFGPRADASGQTSKLDDLRDVTAPFRAGPAAPWTTEVIDVDGISCISDPDGTGDMGVHYVDVDNLQDGRIRRLAPEALIYEPESDGSNQLVAAEYLVLADAWDANHQSAPKLYGQRFERVEAGNRYGLPTFYELHVWHQRYNSLGTFNDWNPRVYCPE